MTVKAYADYYILGHVDAPTVALYRGATKDTLLNGVQRESRKFDHTNYTLDIHLLEPLPDLSDIEQIC